MTPLTKKEIFAELKRLGIIALSELESYLEEYNKYCSECKGQLSSDNS